MNAYACGGCECEQCVQCLHMCAGSAYVWNVCASGACLRACDFRCDVQCLLLCAMFASRAIFGLCAMFAFVYNVCVCDVCCVMLLGHCFFVCGLCLSLVPNPIAVHNVHVDSGV